MYGYVGVSKRTMESREITLDEYIRIIKVDQNGVTHLSDNEIIKCYNDLDSQDKQFLAKQIDNIPDEILQKILNLKDDSDDDSESEYDNPLSQMPSRPMTKDEKERYNRVCNQKAPEHRIPLSVIFGKK